MIKKEGGRYVLYSFSSGKVLGRFKGLKAAQVREKQIQYFKYRKR